MRRAGEVTYGDAHGRRLVRLTGTFYKFSGEIGRNRGIVCFEREEEMKNAVRELDGRDINGRAVELIARVFSIKFFLEISLNIKIGPIGMGK